MIGAANPVLLDPAIEKGSASMGAALRHQPVSPGRIFEDDQILAQEPNLSSAIFIDLRPGSDGHPIAPKQFSHRRARPNASYKLIALLI
jgi:hypothetical protein